MPRDRPTSPETEIEISPEMVEAGAAVLRAYNADWTDPLSSAEEAKVITMIFRANVPKAKSDIRAGLAHRTVQTSKS